MATVTDQIIDVLGREVVDRRIALIEGGSEGIRKLLEELERQVLTELQSVPGETYTSHVLRGNLVAIERHLADFEGRAARELSEILGAAWAAGSELLPAMAAPAGLSVGFGGISTSLLEAMQEFATHKMRGLAAGGLEKIRGELILGMMGQKTPAQVIEAVMGSLTSPGVFDNIRQRATVITQTELGRVYSAATQKSLEAATQNVPDMKKQWWHAGHPKRPRVSHLALHGQVQPVNKPFLVGGLSMMYPRSPEAPVSEIINCGCIHLPWHPEFGELNPDKIKLPIFNARGRVIDRRGPRTGLEEPLIGKFALGAK